MGCRPVALAVVGVLAVGLGCAHQPARPQTSIEHGPLKDVVLLPLTTRSLEGLLGHGLYSDGVTPDPSRCIVRGVPRLSDTSQRVTVVRELSTEALVAGGYGPVSGSVGGQAVTHLAYVVTITGYAAVSDEAAYLPHSDCCFNGQVQAQCELGYVLRLVRGSGVIKYLQHTQTGAQVEAGSLFQSRVGERFRVVDESVFEDAYFAFEPGDTQRLCERLTDVETFAAVAVTPAPNCSAMAYDVEGNGQHLAKFLPDAVACQTVSEHFCARSGATVRCVASYKGRPLALFASSDADAARVTDGPGPREAASTAAPRPPAADRLETGSSRPGRTR